MAQKVGFLAIHASELEWRVDDVVKLPTGVLIKEFCNDPARNLRAFCVKFPVGYHEPRHVHEGTHAVCVLEGKQIVGGKVLERGDFCYGPSNVEHGPFDYPEGCVVFAVFQGDPVHKF